MTKRVRITVTFVLFATAAITLSATPARAQAGSIIVGAGAGAGVPFGSLRDDFNLGLSYSVWGGAGLSDNLDLMVRFGESFFDQKRESQPFFDTTDLTVLTVTVGPRFYLTPPSSLFRPFVSLELGYAGVEANDAGRNPVGDDKRFGFDGGGGFSLGAGRASFDVEARYYRNVGSGSDLDYIVPLAGFSYRFGGESVPGR
jgi:hypothetical protein